jgi:4-amino-4-deoxy-L-arabinose transferase-like glycosyltransferase
MEMENRRLDAKPVVLCLLDITLILAVCLLLSFRGIGDKPFYDKQEAREALVIWEIHNSGNWILPLRNGEEIPAKPPFYHWLGALISMTAGRVDEFTSRLPSAVLGTLGVLLTYATGLILWGRGAGLLSALVLSTSFEWRTARAARVDMALTFVLLCSFLFFLYLYRTGGGRKKAIVLGILLGLAMLAKGPLGLVVPSFTFLTFLLIKKDLAFLKRLHPFTVISVALLVAGSWYLLAFGQGGKNFLLMVVKENFGSVVGRQAGHSHPFWWYIPHLFQNMAPWSLFFPTLGLFVYRYRQKLAKEDLLYIVVWLSTVIIFFSMFSQKRTVYILSAYPAIALLFGAWWHKLKNESTPAEPLFITRLAAYLAAGSFLLLAVSLMLQLSNYRPLDYLIPLLDEKDRLDLLHVAALLTQHRFASLAWSAFCGLGGLFLILAARKNAWGGFLAGTAAIMAISLNNVQSFDTGLAKEYTLKPFMSRVVSIVKDAPLFYYDAQDYSVIFYAGRHIHQYEPTVSKPSSMFYVLFWENEWKKMRTTEGLVVQAKSEGIDRESTREGHLLLVAVEDPYALVPGLSFRHGAEHGKRRTEGVTM